MTTFTVFTLFKEINLWLTYCCLCLFSWEKKYFAKIIRANKFFFEENENRIKGKKDKNFKLPIPDSLKPTGA